MHYELYVADCETTGLDYTIHSPVEISLMRFSTGEQKTWYLKPIDTENISTDALRVNGLKIEDLRGQTEYGRKIYQDPRKTLVEIENWLAEIDECPSETKILAGQNVGFDKNMLLELWKKCDTEGTFPFNPRYSVDTMILQFTLDFAAGEMAEGYSLKNLCKKYGIKNDRAHSAESDVRATAEVFRNQINYLKA